MRFLYGDKCSFSEEFDNFVDMECFIMDICFKLTGGIGSVLQFDSYMPEKKVYIYKVYTFAACGFPLKHYYFLFGFVESDIKLKEIRDIKYV